MYYSFEAANIITIVSAHSFQPQTIFLLIIVPTTSIVKRALITRSIQPILLCKYANSGGGICPGSAFVPT
jgi:hypothetical protein